MPATTAAQPPRVFISYARRDGREFAVALRRRLEREAPDITLWRDIEDLEGGRGWWRQITEAIDQVQYLLLVMTPGAAVSTFCRKEWRYARNQGVGVVPVLVADQAVDFAALPRWMAKIHFFSLSDHWEALLRQLRSPAHVPRVPFMAPDLPDGFVERPTEFGQLLKLVLDPERANPVAITTALHGAGGFGKTTLAAAVCHHDDVLSAFDDGILWVTLGQTPNLRDSLLKLYGALTDDHRPFVDTEDAATALAEKLENRNCLLVIDDVWDQTHLEPFLRGGRDCARLITTRRFDIAAARRHHVQVDEMATDEAVALLAARLPADASDHGALARLAARLGEWPLLLELAAATARRRLARGQTLTDALAYLHHALDRHGVRALSVHNASDRRQSVDVTMRLSLDQLSAGDRDACCALAIFPEDTDVPLAVVAVLWGQDDFQTEARAECLADSSLVRLNLATRTVRLQDVVQKYLAEQLPDAAAKHARLVDALLSEGGPFRDLPRGLSPVSDRAAAAGAGRTARADAAGTWDGLSTAYGWRFLAYHLKHAGRESYLRQLLVDYGWLAAKLNVAWRPGKSASKRPLDTARRRAHKAPSRAHRTAARADPAALVEDYDYLGEPGALSLIRDALRLSAHILAHDPGQLASQLVSRLRTTDDPGILAFRRHVADSQHGPWLCTQFPTLEQAGGPLQRTLVEHTREVRAVSVLGEGHAALSASSDRTIKLWNLDTGRVWRTFAGHAAEVDAVAATPEGRRAVSASRDATLRVWDLGSGRLLHILAGHTAGVTAVAVTPDGRRAVSASSDTTLRVWDLETGQFLHTGPGHTAQAQALALTPDGRHVVSASADGSLQVWDLETGLSGCRLAGHTAGVNALAVTPDGQRVLSASADHTIRVWDLQTGRVERTLTGHAAAVTAVVVTPDGRQAVSATCRGRLRLWCLASGRTVSRLKGHAQAVHALSITPDGRCVISASADRTLKVWNLTTAWLRQRPDGHAGVVRAVAVTPDGGRAVSASSDQTLRVWDLHSGHSRCLSERHERAVTAVAVLPDGRRAVSASADRTLQLVDLETGESERTFVGHGAGICAVALTPDGRRAVSASDDGTFKVWDLSTGCELQTWQKDAGSLSAVAVTPDGRHVIVGAADGLLAVWDWQAPAPVRLLAGHRAGVGAVAATPDGRKIVSGSDDATVKIWDLATGRVLHTLDGHTSRVRALAVMPDSSTVVSGSCDRTLRVWDLTTAALLATFTGESSIRACAVAPDGQTIVAGESSGRVHILKLIQPAAEAVRAQT